MTTPDLIYLSRAKLRRWPMTDGIGKELRNRVGGEIGLDGAKITLGPSQDLTSDTKRGFAPIIYFSSASCKSLIVPRDMCDCRRIHPWLRSATLNLRDLCGSGPPIETDPNAVKQPQR